MEGLRQEYGRRLLDRDRSCERNDHIMRKLCLVESRATALTARTDRLRLLTRHCETYLYRNYPCWKKESPRSHSADLELSSNLQNSALSLPPFSHSPSITREVVPDYQLLEYPKYKFSSETNIASPSARTTQSFDSIKRRDNPNIGALLSRARSYPDIFRDSTIDTSRLLADEQNTSTDLFLLSLSPNKRSQRLPNEEENNNYCTKCKKSITDGSDYYKSKSVFDTKYGTPPFGTDQNVLLRPIPSYKPLRRSRSLHVKPSDFSRPTRNLPPKKRSAAVMRSSIVNQISDSVQSESGFSCPNATIRLASPHAIRRVPPKPEYSNSKRNPLQVVDDIFKKYLINYDQRYLSDPISESKYGKYLYSSKHLDNNFNGREICSPFYTLTSKLPDVNFSNTKGASYLPSRDTIKTNRFDSFGSNESLHDNYTYNRRREINLATYSNKNDWKDWNYYRDRYNYTPELDFKYSYSKLNYPDYYRPRPGSKPWSWNDVNKSSTRILSDSTASRFAEPWRISAHQLSKLSSTIIPSTLDTPILTASNHGDEQSYSALGRGPNKYAMYKASVKPPTTPKKVSFSNNYIDNDNTDNDEYHSSVNDIRRLSVDKLTLNKKALNEFNYKPFVSQDRISDNHSYNSGANKIRDKCQPGELEYSESSTNIYVDKDSYKSPSQGEQNDWKRTPLYSIEDLTVSTSDLANKSNELVKTQETIPNSDVTKYNQKVVTEYEERDVVSPNRMESTKFGKYQLGDKSEESNLSALYSGDNQKDFQIQNEPTNEQQEFQGKVYNGILDKDSTNLIQQKELLGGSDISAIDFTLNGQGTNSSEQCVEDPSLENYTGDQSSEQYNKMSKQYSAHPPAGYDQQEATAAFGLNEKPYSVEQYRQENIPQEYQQSEEYSNTKYGNEYQQPTEFELSGYDQQPTQRSIEYVDDTFRQSSVQDHHSKSSDAFQENDYIQQIPGQSIIYDDNSYPINQEPDGHDVEQEQQHIQDQQTRYDGYIPDQKLPSGFEDSYKQQDPQAGYDQSAQDGQQIPTEHYEGGSYVQDGQEPERHNEETYGQQNVQDPQTGYDDYMQDQKLPSGFEESYIKQDPQAGHDQSAQDGQQIPTEHYEGGNYVQDSQEPEMHNEETYGQQNIQDPQTGYDDYMQDQNLPSGFQDSYIKQDPHAGYDQSAQDVQQIPTEHYEGGNYVQDSQEPEMHNEETYGQQNIQDPQTGYDDYMQDQNLPSGFQDSYIKQDPQAGYDQSAQDGQQIPTEHYDGGNYVQDQYGHDYMQGSQEYLPDQYQSQPTGQEHPHSQFEGEYIADTMQKQYQEEYQHDQTQGQQYEGGYNAPYDQNDPQSQYQQENTTYDQAKQEMYKYDQAGEQYQQPYEGGEQYGNNYEYDTNEYDNQGQVHANGERQHYTQEQVHDVNTVQDNNAQQPYQQLSSGASQPYNVAQYMEGYPEQTLIDSSHSQDTAGYVESPQHSENTAPAASSEVAPAAAADPNRVVQLESDSGAGVGSAPTAVTHSDSGDLNSALK